MFTMDSLVFLAIAVAILFAAVQRGGDGARTMSERTHRAICGAAIAAGVLVRLARLTSLPAGISAEEELVGVHANALWQTGGFLFGQDPKLAAAVTRAARDAAPNKPLIIKLSPNVTDIALMARSVQDAGADMISCINTLSGMAVDVARRKPRLANVIGGLSGPAIKPVALRCVWQVCKAVDIPVIGLGGICSAEDVLEFILVGAHAVQIGTANFISPDRAFEIVKELPAVCRQLGVTSLDELRGSLKTA